MLNLVKSNEFVDDELEKVIGVFKDNIGDVKIKIQFLKDIPDSAQGKRRFVISKFGDIFLNKQDI